MPRPVTISDPCRHAEHRNPYPEWDTVQKSLAYWVSISKKSNVICHIGPSSDDPKITVLFNERCPRSPIQLRCQRKILIRLTSPRMKQVTPCMIPHDSRPAKSKRGATSGSRPLGTPGGRCWHSSPFQGMAEIVPQLRMVAPQTRILLSPSIGLL